MASQDEKYTLGQVLAGVPLPIVTFPTIRAGIRSAEADGGHPSRYYLGLAGKTLQVSTADATGVVFLETATFTTDFLADAIAEINTLTHIAAYDDNGYLRIQSQHAGGIGYIKIQTSSTSATILGVEVQPAPGAASFAGELASSSPAPRSGARQGTELISRDEDLSSSSINRAIFGTTQRLERILRELDREIVGVRKFDVVVVAYGGAKVFRIVNTSLRLPLTAFGIATPNPGAAVLKNMVRFKTAADEDIFLTGFRVGVDAILYDDLTHVLNPASSFAVWGTFDGLSVFGNAAHLQKFKVAPTAITSIRGNLVFCPGANFIAKDAQPGDTVQITGSTKSLPFNHNGEFIIDQLYSQDLISIRPKNPGSELSIYGPPVLTPTSLNDSDNPGTLGSLSVAVGAFLPATSFVFRLTNPGVAVGPYLAYITVGNRLKDMQPTSFANTLAGDPGDIGAFVHIAGDTMTGNLVLPQMTAGNNLAGTDADAELPRHTVHVRGAVPGRYTLITLGSKIGGGTGGNSRIYMNEEGRTVISYNAFYSNAAGVWTRDVPGSQSSVLEFGPGQLLLRVKLDNAVPWGPASWEYSDQFSHDFSFPKGRLTLPGVAEIGLAPPSVGEPLVARIASTPADPTLLSDTLMWSMEAKSPTGVPDPRSIAYQYFSYSSGGGDGWLEFTYGARKTPAGDYQRFAANSVIRFRIRQTDVVVEFKNLGGPDTFSSWDTKWVLGANGRTTVLGSYSEVGKLGTHQRIRATTGSVVDQQLDRIQYATVNYKQELDSPAFSITPNVNISYNVTLASILLSLADNYGFFFAIDVTNIALDEAYWHGTYTVLG